MNETVEFDLRGPDGLLTVYIDVLDHGLSRRWIQALKNIVKNDLHLEKNFCWLGWTESPRTVAYLCEQINASIDHINFSGIDYQINCVPYSINTVIGPDLAVNQDCMNQLHRWFEDLQGWSGGISKHYQQANPTTRWHIRQLNLLCHELESLVLSMRKLIQAPEWRRPSQLMCWLNAPRFELEPQDYELFGIDTINRQMGGVYLGVNKAVGKHHWEVFNDEGRDSRIGELVTTGLRQQTQAAGDFDIEWARDPGAYHWQITKLQEFRQWLLANGFDPEDPSLTIGHPKVAQVDLQRSFGTTDYQIIWAQIAARLDVFKIRIGDFEATYNYCWSDPDYREQQIRRLT